MINSFISFRIFYFMKLIFVSSILLFIFFLISLSLAVEISFSQDLVLKWHKIIERPYPYDGVNCVLNAGDGIVIIGFITVGYDNKDIIVYKLDYSGNILWTKQYGGIRDDLPRAAILTSWNRIIISASSVRQAVPPIPSNWIFELDSLGTITWQNYYPDSLLFEGNDIIEISDGNLVVVGSAVVQPSGNALDYAMVKLSSSGALLWNTTIGEQDVYENAASILQTADRGFVFTGESGYNKSKIVKTDDRGNVEWSKEYGLWQVQNQRLLNSSNDDFLLFYSDYDPSSQDMYQIFIVKYDFKGNTAWNNRCPFQVYGNVLADVIEFKNGSYLSISPFGLLTAFNNLGDKIWQVDSNLNYRTSLATCLENSIILGGAIYKNEGMNISIAMFSQDTLTSVNKSYFSKYSFCLQNYPNPFNLSTTLEFSLPNPEQVSLKVYTLLGEEVTELINEKLAAGTHKAYWNAGDMPSGVYFYLLEAGSYRKIRKAILMK